MVFCQHLNAQKCTNSVGRRGCVDLAGELTELSIVGLPTAAVSPTGLVLRSFGPQAFDLRARATLHLPYDVSELQMTWPP